MKYNLIEIELAQINLLTEADNVCGVFYNSSKHQTILRKMNYNVAQEKSQFVSHVSRQLQEYFSGKLKKFDIPYKFMGGTEFQRKVWNILENIPYGATKTYQEIADEVGNPKAVRAVANAVGMNSLSIIVPCHRVIGSDGKLHGYAGGVSMKERLLEIESKLY